MTWQQVLTSARTEALRCLSVALFLAADRHWGRKEWFGG